MNLLFVIDNLSLLLQANKKTRNRAYDVLVQIARAFGDEENGGGKENVYQFFNMVLNIVDNSFKFSIL